MARSWTPLHGVSRRIALDVLIHGPLSRVELARRHDLSPGSVTRLTKPLLDAGLLVETDLPRGTEPVIGRPQRPLDVVADTQHFVGVKLTGDTAYAVLTTLRAQPVAHAELPLSEPTPDAVAAVIAQLVHRLAGGTSVAAIGVSLGGHAADHRTVTAAPYLHWTGVPFADMVQAATGLPTVVENDVTGLTEAENWFGAGVGLDQFAVLTIGAGIGFGLVVRGQQVTNRDFGLGLVGHVPLDHGGSICHLGHRGCATAMLTMSGITAAAAAAVGRHLTYDDVLDLALTGDPPARRAVDDAGRALGRMLALVANFTMPQSIVVAGEGIRLYEVAEPVIEETFRVERDPDALEVPVEVRTGDFAEWARGAAVVAIQTYVLGTDD